MQTAHKKIISNALIAGGCPTLSGTRLTCADIILFIRDMGIDRFLNLYPYIEINDAQQVKYYCGNKICITNSQNFCHSCSLRQDTDSKLNIWKIANEINI